MSDFPLDDAQALFAVFPEWRAFARSEAEESGVPYLVVHVPAPAEADEEHGLTIDTSNEEVTVGFDCYHSHFNAWDGDGEDVGTLAALEFIKQVVHERVAIVSWWLDEKWCGSSRTAAGSTAEVASWAGAQGCNRIRVRSWNGTFNADISI